MELSLHRLRMLHEFARRGTITDAAAALHYTPSAVSQQLGALEREVGLNCWSRSAAGCVSRRSVAPSPSTAPKSSRQRSERE
ncbi:LysR family transcriptional regulator [Parasphingorhabdus pacifica]